MLHSNYSSYHKYFRNWLFFQDKSVLSDILCHGRINNRKWNYISLCCVTLSHMINAKRVFIGGFLSFGFSRKHFSFNLWQVKVEISTVTNNLTTFNNISDKQIASATYK